MNQLEPHYSLEETARRGDEIYETRIRAQVEHSHQGQVVAIDLETGDYAIGANAVEASKLLQAQHPVTDMWFVRVGHRTLHRIAQCFWEKQ